MKKTDIILRNIEKILLVPTVGVLAAGTFVEKFHDNDYARSHIYGSWWFMALLALIGLYAIWRMIGEMRRGDGKVGERLHKVLLFGSVVFILAGGMLTMTTGQHGRMELKPGVATNSFFIDEEEEEELPFAVTLNSFEVIPYPGTNSPMDFVSHVVVEGEECDISMNNICRHKGYRFYQEDYDDEGGSTLSVAHDPWGIGMTYAGYVLMALGIIVLFGNRQSDFRRLLRNAAVVVLFLGFQLSFIDSANAAVAADAVPHTLPKSTADKMGQMYVLYKGRVCPLQTMAKDFTTKLCGKARYKGLTAEQVLSGWLFYSGEWVEEPMIKVKGDDVLKMLGSDDKRVSYMQLLAHDEQLASRKQMPSAMGGSMMPMPGQMMSKTMRAASEKYNLVQMLISGKYVKIYPLADSAGAIGWYGQNDDLPKATPDDDYFFVRKQLSYCQELVLEEDYEELERVFDKTIEYQRKHAAEVLPTKASYRAERIYNGLTTGRWLAMLVVTMGLVFFAWAIFRSGKPSNKRQTLVINIQLVIVALITLFLLTLFVLRWIAGGHAPMAGGFDSMNLMAIAIGIVGIAMTRRHTMSPSIALFSMGFCLLVAMMSGSNPPVTHLMPVLSSPLLTLHVTVIMISYALFFFVMLNGVVGLIVSGSREIMRISKLMLYPAVALLGIGIVIGAIWANISWGNYWSWDPKEVWALITLLVYLYPLMHDGREMGTKAFHIYCILAFFSVIITYFGVNLILGGIHAYN